MFKQFLSGATGVDTYLIFSLFIFLIFFVGVSIWVWKADNKQINQIKQIPLQD